MSSWAFSRTSKSFAKQICTSVADSKVKSAILAALSREPNYNVHLT